MKLAKRTSRRWIKALRSGEYVQGDGVLCRDPRGSSYSRFCCLGVLCDISPRVEWVGNDLSDRDEHLLAVYNPSYGFGESVVALPQGLLEEIGLSHGREWVLMGMNDQGCNFRDIADRIEEWLEEDWNA